MEREGDTVRSHGSAVLTARLEELRSEHEKGQRYLETLDRQRHELRDRLLRIGGAIQVLEELLEQEASAPGEPSVLANGRSDPH
jgi:hypothetical protein